MRRSLFPFRIRSLPFLTSDAIIGNQAFNYGRCNICSGLSYNKATNTLLNSLRKNNNNNNNNNDNNNNNNNDNGLLAKSTGWLFLR